MKNTLRTTVIAVGLLSGAAWATDGYFPHGYGIKAKGMGGVSLAMTDNAFAGANNPAVASFAGNRAELGVDVFMPKRGASRTGSPMGMMDGDIESDTKTFLVPEFGYNRQISPSTAVGLTVYGNGGMNTDYPATGFNCGPRATNMLCGSSKLGVNLMQLIVAPTLAYKLSESSAIGIAPLLVYQQFKATGLQAFAGNPNWTGPQPNNYAPNTTDNGNDSSTGLGVRLGFNASLNDAVRVGASYSPKTNMSKFKKYSQLFAEGGDFDIPENYAAGFAVQATSELTIAADYQRINYSKVKAIGNSMTQGGPLGAVNGPGFGWSDVDVVKLGVEWKYSGSTVLRAGYNHTTNPVKAANVTFNIIAPGVITKHYTVGATTTLDNKAELTLAYMYAPKSTVTGESMLAIMNQTSFQETIRMSQQSLGIQYGWKF